jgi:23S rRNA (guanosine2251-2'-O)-methyltransferase
MDKNISYEYLYGINPVYSLLTRNAGNRKIYEIILNKKRKSNSRIQNIIREAVSKNIEVLELESGKFNEISHEDVYTQGVYARVSNYNYCNLEHYLNRSVNRDSRLLILDGITDVGNFGSIIRNCCAFNFEGIIIQKRRSVALNERISKISAGTLEEVKIFRVTNIVGTLKELKNKGFWIYGTTLDTTQEVKYISDVDFTLPLAVVFGSEDKGISRLVSKNCDFMVTVNLSGKIQSLNVSTASGIILYTIQENVYRN